MLTSPLAGTAGVLVAMGLLAIPLHRLTSQTSATPPQPTAAPASDAKAAIPALLRLKLLTPVPVFRLKTPDGTTLLDLAALPAGESEHDTAIHLVDGHLELLVEADLGPAEAETAVFLTVMPDGMEDRTRYLIGSGGQSELLRFEWQHGGP
jgi:hypothetical protein